MSAESQFEQANPFSVPEGFTAVSSQAKSAFNVEELDDDKELWLIRLPNNVPVEALTKMKIKLPSERSRKALGKLNQDNDSFALYRVPQTHKNHEDNGKEDQEVDFGISGQEMSGFSCLLPSRNQEGKLVFAPVAFKHQLIMDQVVQIPDSTEIAKKIRETPVTKRPQPEGLKMRFKPYGFDTGEPLQQSTTEQQHPVNASTTSKEGKKRKRDTGEDDKEKKKKKKDKKEKAK